VEQLTTKQKAAIDDYVRNNYVQYDDVRFKVVDNLSSEIEAALQGNPDRVFDDLIQETVLLHEKRLKSLVKKTKWQLRWFWSKRIVLSAFQVLFSMRVLIPVVAYAILLGLSQVLSSFWIFILFIIVLFAIRPYFSVHRTQVKLESQRFLASHSFLWVLGLVIVPIYILMNLVPLLQKSNFISFEIQLVPSLIAIIVFMILWMESAFKLLSDYYEQHPEINELRRARGFMEM